MRWSLTTSFMLHAAILIAALVVLPNPKEFVVSPQQSIQVDISKISDTTKQMAAKQDEKPVEQPKPKKVEAPKPETKPAPKVAEVEKKAVTEAKTEPQPEPKKEEPKPLDAEPLKDLIKDTVTEAPQPEKAKPKPEETKKAEVKPKEKPKKPEKKKPKLNMDEIAAFLNKTDDQKAAPEQPSEGEQTASNDKATQGTDSKLSATIIDAFVQRLRQCWTVPPGAREANIMVKIHFVLNPDGSVAGVPDIVDAGSDLLSDATARSAVAAIMECQNYDFLPKDRYDMWQDNTLVFNPNMMSDS